MKKRKWIKWVILLLIVAAVGAVGFAVFAGGSQQASYGEETVESASLTTYYNFDGTVYAPAVQTIAADAAGTVERVYAARNQQVKEGDRLYAMESGGAVRAGMDGELTGLYVSEGDVVAAGETTAQIIDMDRLEVRLNVDEYDVSAVTPGTPVAVTVLSTDARYDGTVTALDKNGTVSGDLSYYTATVEMPAMEGAYPGMQISAQVLRGHVDNAPVLHVDSLQFDEYNKPYVLMRGEDGEAARVPVTVGISDGVYCEIVDGVQAGDTVLVPTGMSIMELMEQMRTSARN